MLAPLLGVSCSRSETDLCLKELDQCIAARKELEKDFHNKVGAMQQRLEKAADDSLRWEACSGLFNIYISHDLDSANVFAGMMEGCAATARQRNLTAMMSAYVASSYRKYDEALALMDAVKYQDLDEYESVQYYDTMEGICSLITRETSLSDEDLRRYNDTKLECFRNILQHDCLTEPQRNYYQGRLDQMEGRYEQAIAYLEESLKHPEPGFVAHAGYAMANCCKQTGRDRMWVVWLARTAVTDLEMYHRSYRALFDLSLSLYDAGDYSRAERYLNTTISDAIASHYDTRIVTASETKLLISAVDRQRERRIRAILTLLLVVLVGSATMLAVLYRRQSVLNRRLAKANESLGQANERLVEVDKIKESYLFMYMDLSASYIKDMDNYKHTLLKTLQQEGAEALKNELRRPEDTYMKYEKFYEIFDRIFLSIYPDFIEEVNSMLPEEHRYPVGVRKLNTEQRILAVMKLGMRKSSKIATFLNISANTVYTYRVKIKSLLSQPSGFFRNADTLTDAPTEGIQ